MLVGPLEKQKRPFNTQYYSNTGRLEKDELNHPEICESAFPRSGNHQPVVDLIFGRYDAPEDFEPDDIEDDDYE